MDIIGKTIKTVVKKPTWETALSKLDTQDIEELVIQFTDGTKLNIVVGGPEIENMASHFLKITESV